MNRHELYFEILRLQRDYSCEILYNMDFFYNKLNVKVYFCPPNESKNFDLAIDLVTLSGEAGELSHVLAKKIEERLNGKG